MKNKHVTKSSKKQFRDPNDYTSIYANNRHALITNIDQIKKYNYYEMALFYKAVDIGCGELLIVSRKNKHLQTDGVSLDHEYRKKGHGIFLYHHLIDTAIRLGAVRLYSSKNLNEHSRRMWSEKLPKFYSVKTEYTRSECKGCGSHHKRVSRYYIDLKKED